MNRSSAAAADRLLALRRATRGWLSLVVLGLLPAGVCLAMDLPGLGELPARYARDHGKRLEAGTGWSPGWKAPLWARLLDSDRTRSFIRRLMRSSTLGPRPDFAGYGRICISLLNAHPLTPIDGDISCVADLAEKLLRSHRAEIDLLPAWVEEAVRGVSRGAGSGQIEAPVAEPTIGSGESAFHARESNRLRPQ